MTGTLHDSSTPSNAAKGTFFFSLSGSTLSYSISTGLLPVSDFDLSAADFNLRAGTDEISLPLSGHVVGGVSGCSLTFTAFAPLSLRLPDSGAAFPPLGIADLGICDAYFEMSELQGSVEISQEDIRLFERPDFRVSVGSLGFIGQTDPEVSVIPEPTTLSLLSLLTLLLGRRRRLG